MRCAVLGTTFGGLAMAWRLMKLGHDVWLVATEAEEAARLREEAQERLLCTIHASYAVRRADVVVIGDECLNHCGQWARGEFPSAGMKAKVDLKAKGGMGENTQAGGVGGAGSIVRRDSDSLLQRLATWLTPLLAPHASVILAAEVEPGTTARLRTELALHMQAEHTMAYVPLIAFSGNGPLVLGTSNGVPCPHMVKLFAPFQRAVCFTKDSVAEHYAALAIGGANRLRRPMLNDEAELEACRLWRAHQQVWLQDVELWRGLE
ncbi:hypothetical protein [Paenibacillus sp. 481]|uniref:hypothetical protein n=1 Tax=Paenibacillus sp. 481 TaxID=2835869 RepID=UPI001E2F2FFC|nr:hypothetical protein [Paenibacillus sp. 481]UHA71974.1 hypothetical protein KIK04_14695 [Paenibacillus sp. 481]